MIHFSINSAMGCKCCVPGCRSGYSEIGARSKSNHRSLSKSPSSDSCVSFHRFPTSECDRLRWCRAIPRSHFIPTSSSRVCSLHFYKEDYHIISRDSNSHRKSSRPRSLLKNPLLKDSAVPRIFPNCPSYLSSVPSVTRSDNSSTVSRIRIENDGILHREKQLFDAERVNSLKELREKLLETTLPEGYCVIDCAD